MTQEMAASNKELVRRFYEEVYVNWNMSLADDVVSPQFRSHDWPEAGPTGPKAFRNYYSALRDRKSTRLNSSHTSKSRMPSSA